MWRVGTFARWTLLWSSFGLGSGRTAVFATAVVKMHIVSHGCSFPAYLAVNIPQESGSMSIGE
jgi:hypothetical protein